MTQEFWFPIFKKLYEIEDKNERSGTGASTVKMWMNYLKYTENFWFV